MIATWIIDPTLPRLPSARIHWCSFTHLSCLNGQQPDVLIRPADVGKNVCGRSRSCSQRPNDETKVSFNLCSCYHGLGFPLLAFGALVEHIVPLAGTIILSLRYKQA